MRTELETPGYRNNGKYQFTVGYTGGGNPMCVHLSAEQIAERATKKLGGGRLVDDGTKLFWEQDFDTEDTGDTA